MQSRFFSILLATLLSAGATPAGADGDAPALAQRVEELARENAELRATLETLGEEVRRARDEALAAQDLARENARPRRPLPPVDAATEAPQPGLRIGRANLQLLDVALDVIVAAGWSEARDAQIELLQGGGHDPRQRGFTLQQAELSLLGAVDPYFTAEAHLIYFIDPEGESRFEIEEAFATTQLLPFGLEQHGLQLELGHFFTEFGRINPQHPHAWDWQDQPVILSRLFGEDGARAPGARLGWLTPLPWFSELHFGVQNAKGETMASFLASDEVFEERAPGGRPFDAAKVSNAGDLLYLVRWVNGFDLSDTLSAQLGASALFGPNGTGSDGRTTVLGGDVVVKWRPLATDRGWPYIVWQSEFLHRNYVADDFLGCPVEDCTADVALQDTRLQDWGLYSQLLWGFRRGWAAGLRYEHARSQGSGVTFDETTETFSSVSRNADPLRDTRHRIAPLLVYHPSEFSRLRLQYNYDRAQSFSDRNIHSVWAGLELLFGAHPAHAY